MSDDIRKNIQSPRGYNFIVDATGTVLLSTDRTKENTENIQQNRDLREILAGGSLDEGIKEAEYSNARGLFAYKKHKDLGVIFCMFTPYSDYKNLRQGKGEEYASVIFDTKFFVPVYALLAGSFFIFFMIIAGLVGSPYKPIKKIVRALRHVDEDGFELMLPKIRKGAYKRVIDALVILKGRVKAAEEKTEKLSKMSKELEEELSKEASRADMEISELRDAVKIAENNKTRAEEEILKIKEEAQKEKQNFGIKIKEEQKKLEEKIKEIEKDNLKLKEEIKTAHQSQVPAEKENMRMESVLMMNTELKGVLSVIKTYISSVLGGEGKITDAQQQFLGVVINKSARLERLISDLTELARLEKGEVKFAKQPVDANTVIQDILFAIQPQADVKKVEINTSFSPSLTTVSGDSSRLSSIITQLITQAIKVSPRGGKIIAETKEDGKNVLIRLTDFGMSMPKDKTQALFMNFHGPESLAGPEFINTGLRFPIIKAAIVNMGGDIWLESEIGKGKTFVISLPKDNEIKPAFGGFSPKVRETIIKSTGSELKKEETQDFDLPDSLDEIDNKKEDKNIDLPSELPDLSDIEKPAEPKLAGIPPVPESSKPAEPKLTGIPPVPELSKPAEPKLAGIPPVPESPKPAEPKLAGIPPVPESPKPAEPKSDGQAVEKPKLANPFGDMFGESPVEPKKSTPPQGGSFKIQSNAAGSNISESKPEKTPPESKKIDTVSELLAFSSEPEKKKDLPGSDLNVPQDLLDKKKSAPEDLPPLPDLEDDKGTDIL